VGHQERSNLKTGNGETTYVTIPDNTLLDMIHTAWRPRQFDAGESTTISLVLNLPLTSVALVISGTLTIQSYDGAEISVSVSAGHNYSVDVATQRVQIVVQNTSSEPQVIERTNICGTPVIAGETQSITGGSGDVPQTRAWLRSPWATTLSCVRSACPPSARTSSGTASARLRQSLFGSHDQTCQECAGTMSEHVGSLSEHSA
jgi:hypothetical protein